MVSIVFLYVIVSSIVWIVVMFSPVIPTLDNTVHNIDANINNQWAPSLQDFDDVDDDAMLTEEMPVLTRLQRYIDTESHEKPRIFVYQFPSLYNEKLLKKRSWCKQGIFATEILLHEYLLESEYRVIHPEDANLFYVPIYPTCLMYRNFELFYTYRRFIRKAIEFVKLKYPYFNRSMGSDHIWPLVHDFGACLSWNETNSGVYFDEFRNGIIVSHLGDLTYPCFSTFKDIVIPPFVSDMNIINGRGGIDMDPKERTSLVHFRGTVSWKHPNDLRHLNLKKGIDHSYSRGVRRKLHELYAEDSDFKFHEGSSPNYIVEVKQAQFCLCPRGYATWSRRLFDAVLLGCIPVIIADGVELPFERSLDYSTFTVKISENNIPLLKTKLLSLTNEEILSKQLMMKRVWRAFVYNSSLPGNAYDHILEALSQRVRPHPAVAGQGYL